VYTIKLVVQSAIGCRSDTLQQQLTINALPIADFSVGSPTCIGQPTPFTSTSTATNGTLTRWIWNYGDGSTTDTLVGNITHTYTNSNTYTVSLAVYSSKGCKSSDTTRSVNIGLPPVPRFGLPQVCLNDPFAQFTDSSTIEDGTMASFQYLWNFGDANATPNNPNTSSVRNARHQYAAVGNYSVSLTVTSASGCSATASRLLTINGGTPIAAFAIQNSGNICAADTIVLQNQSSVNYGNITRTEVFWDYANNPTVKQVDSFPALNKLYRHVYTGAVQPTQTYIVRLLAYSGGVCVSSSDQSIIVHATPIAAVSVRPAQLCLGTPFTFVDSSNNPGLSIANWRWNFGDGDTASGQPVQHTYGTANAFNVRLQNQSAQGCLSKPAVRTIAVSPLPQVSAGPDVFVLEGGQVQIKAAVSGSSAYQYAWLPATWLSSSSILQPIVTPLSDVTYTLSVTAAGGCTASDSVTVKLLKQLAIPNAFSPNGDGINDKWVIQSLESYPNSIIQVFDRYGRIVFTAPTGTNIAWDGTYKGTALPTGTYYYVIDPRNGRPATSGSVTILR
jgi:gliding motility-associated-like protein